MKYHSRATNDLMRRQTIGIPHICHFFSTGTILAKFFSTQKRVNRTKTDFATKQRKLQKQLIWQQNIVKCNKTP